MLAAGGFGAGLAHGLASSDAGQIGRLTVAALVRVPAVWVLVGIGVALCGLVPRAAVMGGIDVVLPEGVDVHVSGLSFMGGREVNVAEGSPRPGFPVVHVRAFAVMGGITVKTKRPGSGKNLDRH